MKKLVLGILFSIVVATCTFGQNKVKLAYDSDYLELQQPGDTVYRHNHHKLEELSSAICNGNNTILSCRTKSGDSISIFITVAAFDSKKHKLSSSDTKTCNNCLPCYDLIDGSKAYGIDCSTPRYEITRMAITWNDSNIVIPFKAFHNLYDPNVCTTNLYRSFAAIEGYVTKGEKLLYLYCSAGDGAGSYAWKMVFDKHKYITRMVTTSDIYDHWDYLDGIITPNE